METVEKAERTIRQEFKKLAKKTAPTSIGRPKNELVAEFWDAIYVKRLEAVFYQSQQLGFTQQLIDCVESAVTDVANNRSGKAMHLGKEHIKKSALEKLNGAKTVELVKNFDDRATRCVQAVRNAVAAAAAALYEKQFPPARARAEEAKIA